MASKILHDLALAIFCALLCSILELQRLALLVHLLGFTLFASAWNTFPFLFAWLTTYYPSALTSSWLLSLGQILCLFCTYFPQTLLTVWNFVFAWHFDHSISHILDCKLLFDHLCIPVSNSSPNKEERAKYTLTGWANEEMNTCALSSTTGWSGGALTSTEPWLQNNSLTNYLCESVGFARLSTISFDHLIICHLNFRFSHHVHFEWRSFSKYCLLG